jgi:hypothetical protein
LLPVANVVRHVDLLWLLIPANANKTTANIFEQPKSNKKKLCQKRDGSALFENKMVARQRPEAEFLEVIGTKDSTLLFTVTSTNGFYPPPPPAQKWLKIG